MRLGTLGLGSDPPGHFLAAWPQVSCGVFSSINWGGWDHAVSCLTVILGEVNDNSSDSAQDVLLGSPPYIFCLLLQAILRFLRNFELARGQGRRLETLGSDSSLGQPAKDLGAFLQSYLPKCPSFTSH